MYYRAKKKREKKKINIREEPANGWRGLYPEQYNRNGSRSSAPPAAIPCMLMGNIGSFGTVITVSRDSSRACDAINKGIICRKN